MPKFRVTYKRRVLQTIVEEIKAGDIRLAWEEARRRLNDDEVDYVNQPCTDEIDVHSVKEIT